MTRKVLILSTITQHCDAFPFSLPHSEDRLACPGGTDPVARGQEKET
jgi:hypothetical protein